MGRSLLILLDTHVVIWLAQDYRRISPAAQKAISKAREKDRGLAVCGITLIEIVRLSSRGRIHLTPSVETVLSEIEHRFIVFPITGNIALQAFELPTGYPNDPADRIIGATALVEGLSLLTADRAIRRARVVQTIW